MMFFFLGYENNLVLKIILARQTDKKKLKANMLKRIAAAIETSEGLVFDWINYS